MRIPTSEITSENVPPPAGAYSQARRVGPILRISGQLATGESVSTVADQTLAALGQVGTLLDAAGTTWANVVSVNVYLASDSYFDEFDRAYSQYLHSPFPARTTVSCELAPGAFVEIDALAYVGP